MVQVNAASVIAGLKRGASWRGLRSGVMPSGQPRPPLERRAIQTPNRCSIHPVGPRDISLRLPITHACDSFFALVSV